MYMPSGLVSCIIPVFNGEKYVAETIESVIKQTYANIEIIVVNDGSIDNTLAELRPFRKQISLYIQPNLGQSAARNTGLKMAQGEYISFLDADDLWDSEKTQLQMDYLTANPSILACFAHVRNFWIPELQSEKEQLEREGLIKFIHPFSLCTFLAKRCVFEQVGDFKTELSYGEDSDLFARLKEANLATAVVPRCLAFRRLHESNITRNKPYFRKQDIFDQARVALLRRQAENSK